MSVLSYFTWAEDFLSLSLSLFLPGHCVAVGHDVLVGKVYSFTAVS